MPPLKKPTCPQPRWELKPDWWQEAPLSFKETLAEWCEIPIGAVPFLNPKKVINTFLGCGCLIFASPDAACPTCKGLGILKEKGLLIDNLADDVDIP